METPGLFWGIVLKPDKRYETVVEEDFRLTKACVDTSTLEKGKIASVVLEKGSEEFILCNLTGPSNYDSSIDISFAEGEKICFRTEGGASIHLTGHLVPDESPDESMMLGDSMFDTTGDGEEVSDEEEEDSDDDDGEEEEVPKLVEAANGKRKLENGDSPKQSAKKAKKAEVKQAEAMQKVLSKDKKKKQEDDDEDDDDDDMEADMDDLEEEEDSEDGGEEEESGEDEEEEAPTPKKKKEETPKKDKKKKQQENGTANGQQQASPSKKEKKKQEAAPLTPTSKTVEAETPKSKKKDKKNKNKDGAATPAAAAGGSAGDAKPGSPAKTPKPQKKTLKGGIIAEDIRVGNGPEAKAGKHVGMYYKGTLTKSGKQFDACLQGKPFKFKLGKGEVIKGWDVGVEGMKVGGKRKLTIPAQMGYGAQGAMPEIPPNASLTFEVECKMVN